MFLDPDGEQSARRKLGPAVVGDFEALHRKVRRAAGDDWHYLQAIELRKASGKEKLAILVRQDIARACAVVRLEVDGEIPDRQDQWVRVRALDVPSELTPQSATSQRDALLLEIRQLRTALNDLGTQLLDRVDTLSRNVDQVEQATLRLPN